MKNKFAFVLAGMLAISSAAFAADWRDNGHRGDHRGGYHQDYQGWDRGHDRDHWRRDWNRPRGSVYFGVTPSYGYVAPAPYVDPYAYTTPAPYVDQYAAPYADEYVGPPPFSGAVWIGGYWTNGPRGRCWNSGHWGHR
jgi:hypothetical protein